MDLVTAKHLIEQALCEPPEELPFKHHYKYIPYYHLMFLLVKHLAEQRPGERIVVVEVGFDEGRGAACFAAASPMADVYAIDHTFRDPARDVLEKYPNITFLHRMSVPAPLDVLPPIDILHLDTEHTYDQVKSEFEAYEPGLAPGAVILIDDLRKVNDEVLKLFHRIPWPKIQDDRLHPSTHFMKDVVEGYGIVLMPDYWEGGVPWEKRLSVPWIPYLAKQFLDYHLTYDMQVFEWGSGGSTLYFADKCCHVVSVEHDSGWFEHDSGWFGEVELSSRKALRLLVPPEPGALTMPHSKSDPEAYYSECMGDVNFRKYAGSIDDYGMFDLVFVDGRARPSCLLHGHKHVKPGGFLLLDNSDRAYYLQETLQYFEGWESVVFHGYGPYLDHMWEARCWKRPL